MTITNSNGNSFERLLLIPEPHNIRGHVKKHQVLAFMDNHPVSGKF